MAGACVLPDEQSWAADGEAAGRGRCSGLPGVAPGLGTGIGRFSPGIAGGGSGAGGPESLRGGTARDGGPEGGADRQGRTPAVGLARGGIADATQRAQGQGEDGAPAS